jgi:hypothetical protein
MKKLVALPVMLAVVLGITVPALGQQGNTVRPTQETEQAVQSGDSEVGSDINIIGDYNSVCSPIQQSSDPDNDVNSAGLQPSQAGLIDPEVAFVSEDGNLEQATECVPTLAQESAAAS